jgi:hypothetical protein
MKKQLPSVPMATGPHKLVREGRWPTPLKKLPSVSIQQDNPFSLSSMDYCLARNEEVAMLNNAQVNRKRDTKER